MHEAERIIREEHRSIAAVLHGLIFQMREVTGRGAPPDFKVLKAMLDYIVSFPEQLHHPKEEEYLFAALRRRDPQAAGMLAALEAEHVTGDELIRALQESLLAYEKEGAVKAQAFREAVEEYADFHWQHMRREEDELLPWANKALTSQDWEAVGRAFKENDDPLFGIKPKEEFERLFSRIVEITPPPIGLGSPTHH
jgi:hemerythrin-like domain-containing protein